MKKNTKKIILFIIIPIVLMVAVAAVTIGLNKQTDVKYYEIVDSIKNNEVSEYTLNLYSGELKYRMRADGKMYTYTIADPNLFYNDVHTFVTEKNDELKEQGKAEEIIKFDYERGGETSWIMNILPTVLTIGVIIFFWIF